MIGGKAGSELDINQTSLPRIIIVRGGGVGDFLLTLPVIFESLSRYREVILFTKNSYRELLPQDLQKVRTFDLDSELENLPSFAEGADLITFWKDSIWVREVEGYGLRRLHLLESRPSDEPHVTQAMFKKLDWRISSETLRSAWLGDHWNPSSETLWIHPGSGSSQKNAPFSIFEKRAKEWLARRTDNTVVFSFGEADQALKIIVLESDLCSDPRVQTKTYQSLRDFKDTLSAFAGSFVGNDSGPSHLAAMLGIPTDVFFRSTNPMIWKPLGPRVRVYLDESGANRIL